VNWNTEKIQHLLRVLIAYINELQRYRYLKVFFGVFIVFFLGLKYGHYSRAETPLTELPQAPEQGTAISIFDFTSYLILKAHSFRDDNRVNTFSTIGVVINPELVKRIKIDPKIVAEKQRLVAQYIELYRPVAERERKKFGIPTAITLAQGLLESDAGGSRLARDNNNHFGIKCFLTTCQKGHCTNYTDDTHKDFFINYNNPWDSFRAHSLFLLKPRYAELFKLSEKDYKGWAKGLQQAGYATDQRYAEKLIKIIEDLDLK
jgi:hypothetical protein